MAAQTKKPHEVTCAYLRRWSVSSEGGKQGLWYFDIERQQMRFSTESDRHSFASERYLYMALREGKRNQNVERWFGGMEDAFIGLLERIEAGAVDSRPPTQQVALAVMCAVSLGYRSGFEIRGIEQLLVENAEFRKRYGEPPVEDAHHLAVENMVCVIAREAQRYVKATFLTRLAAPLLVCDRPLLALPNGEQAFVPLGPHSLLALESSTTATEFLVQFAAASEQSAGLAETINRFTLERARKWVVAASKDQLEGVLPHLSHELVADRRRKDRVVYMSPRGGELELSLNTLVRH